MWNGSALLHILGKVDVSEEILEYLDENFVAWIFLDGFVPMTKLTGEEIVI